MISPEAALKAGESVMFCFKSSAFLKVNMFYNRTLYKNDLEN